MIPTQLKTTRHGMRGAGAHPAGERSGRNALVRSQPLRRLVSAGDASCGTGVALGFGHRCSISFVRFEFQKRPDEAVGLIGQRSKGTPRCPAECAGADTVALNAAAEQGHTPRRARRRSGPRARVRQPRLPARRARRDQAALQRQALDRLPARVPRLEADEAAAARPVHGAVLPGRGDRVRRRPPPLRPLPQRGLPGLRGHLARASSRRRTRGERDRRAAARRAGRAGLARPAAPRGTVRRAAGRRVRPPRHGAVPRAGRPPPGVDTCGLRGAGGSPSGPRNHSHTTLARRGATEGWQGALPLLHPSARTAMAG